MNRESDNLGWLPNVCDPLPKVLMSGILLEAQKGKIGKTTPSSKFLIRSHTNSIMSCLSYIMDYYTSS